MNSVDELDVFGLTGTTLEGRFIIERAIAEGGFGVVYRAQQAALGRPVAVKVLKTPAQFDAAAKQQFLASFAQEARTIAGMSHPNIVHVHDFGISEMPSGERAAWMVLEWLTGETLDDELMRRRGHGGRTPAECLSLLKPALSALTVVHAAGVAHRDLKPANIMLVATPGGPSLKVLDFGIAKMMDADEMPGTGETQTRSSQVAFSPCYASPEQVRRGRSGPWTDVHAVGLILTEMLTDRPPLDGATMAILFEQVADRIRPTPAKFGVAVGAWEAVLCRAMALSTAERYRDASELLHALEAALPSNVSAAFDATVVAVPIQPVPAPTPSGPHVTTNTPPADVARSMPASGGTRRRLYVGAATAATITMAAGLGWRSITTGADAPTSDSVRLGDPPRSAAARFGTMRVLTPPPATSSESPSAAGVGYLSLDTYPWTQVSEGGTQLGTTPLIRQPLSAGTHTLRLDNREMSIHQTYAVAVLAGESVAKQLALAGSIVAPATSEAMDTMRQWAAANCNPPFSVDARGTKHLKDACETPRSPPTRP